MYPLRTFMRKIYNLHDMSPTLLSPKSVSLICPNAVIKRLK